MEGSHQVELTGALEDVRFPTLCASCGAAPPAGDVPLEKMFRRTRYRRPSTYAFARLRVPLCRDCLGAHERARRPLDPAARRAMQRQWLVRVLPYAIPIGVQLFMIGQFAPQALAELPGLVATPPRWDAVIWLGAAALFVAFLAMFLWLAVRAGRPLTTGVWTEPDATHVQTTPGPLGSTYVVAGPPTPTLAAVDFTDERVELFAPDHRAFTFASAAVASQFAALNAARAWDPASPRVRRARRAETVVVALVVAATAVAIVLDFVRG